MTLYKATKNLFFTSLSKGVIVGETVDLEDAYAKQVNKDLKLTFPDVDAVLVPVDGAVNDTADEPAKDEKPKRTRKSKTDTETEPAEDAAE